MTLRGRPVRRPVVVRRSVPAARLGAPQPQAATGELVDRAVGRPGETDEPARRQPRTALAVVGCLVSLDLVRPHLGDLRRTRFAETASSYPSH
jgi:hypothetical protein